MRLTLYSVQLVRHAGLRDHRAQPPALPIGQVVRVERRGVGADAQAQLRRGDEVAQRLLVAQERHGDQIARA